MKFSPMIRPENASTDNTYLFIFKGDLLIVTDTGNSMSLPSDNISLHLFDRHFIGSIDGIHCYAASVSVDTELQAPYRFENLRSIYGTFENAVYSAACYAFHFVQWNRNTRYCGRCGGIMNFMETERAKQCQGCNHIVYPSLSPCIIVAIIKDKRLLLLAKINRPGIDLYSVLAGFVEMGETLEECIQREVMEEVGITIKNIRYFGSQPWAFSQSLMIGFTAEYSSGEIVVDGKEIPEADWYSADTLPKIPDKRSIARELIDWFVAGQQPR